MSIDVKAILPGVGVATVTGLAALFLSEHYGAPAMLFALLLGIAMSFLYEDSPCTKGIEFSATFILRVGVALLGLRIALNDLFSLGWEVIAILIAAIASTITLGIVLSKQFKLSKSFGALTGGSVAICGASAAMAITAILPEHKDKEQNTLVTIIGVTSLSTIAMVVYPIIVSYLSFNNIDSGIFLGGTIHDVAQVVGAGYSISEETGDISTLVKLVRVSFLMPVVLIMLYIIKRNTNNDSKHAKNAKVPTFLIAFIILMIINSCVNLPTIVLEPAVNFSRFALVISIAAIGMKSNFAKLKCVGFKPIVLMIVETAWIAAFILSAIWLIQ